MRSRTKPDAGTIDVRRANILLDGGDMFSERLIYRYFLNLMEHTKISSPFAYAICAAAEEDLKLSEQGIKFPAKKEKDKRFYGAVGAKAKVVPEDWQTLKEHFQEQLALAESEPVFDVVHENLMKLADYLNLDELGKKVLELAYGCGNSGQYWDFMESSSRGSNKMAPVVSRMLGRPDDVQKIATLLSPSGPLATYGLIDVECAFGSFPMVDPALFDKLDEGGMSEEAIVGHLLGKPTKSELRIDDFAHLGPDMELAINILKNAVQRGEKGINIMIVGPPGGGKTELAKTIADHLGLRMYAVGEEDQSGDADDDGYVDHDEDDITIKMPKTEKTSEKRLGHHQRAQALLKDNKNAILLFDEMEDVLRKGTDSDKKADPESKVRLNRILEENAVPTIWIANDAEKFHRAVRQRFSFSLSIDYPPTIVRRKMWERQLEMQEQALPDAVVLDLARKYDAPPRMIYKAVRGMKLTGGSRDVVERMLEADARITVGSGQGILSTSPVPSQFDLSLVEMPAESLAMTAELIERGRCHLEPFSLLVEAPRGAGASSFLRYIGEGMVRNVQEEDMHQLSTPTAMSSPEGNIQNAFARAADSRDFLIIHEPEIIMTDEDLVRVFSRAVREHKGPLAVVSRKPEKLTGAVKALFSHNLAIGRLSPERARSAYETFFHDKPPAGLDGIEGLVTADFAEAGRLARLSGVGGPDSARILELLTLQKAVRQEKTGIKFR